MRSRFSFIITLLLFGTLIICLRAAQSQGKSGTSVQGVVTNVRVDKLQSSFFGSLYVTVNGKEKRVAAGAIEAWIIDGGRKVLYSSRDGAGGYENEGQSLRVYTAQTGRITKVMSEYFAVTDMVEVKTSTGRIALIVKMSDGGLGAQYIAVVDPLRGEVFFKRWARLLSRKGDVIRIGFYRADDWSAFLENENAAVRPYKTEHYNLIAVLKRPVIINKRQQP